MSENSVVKKSASRLSARMVNIIKQTGALAVCIWLIQGGLAHAACNANIAESTPTADFVDHGDGTVTHAKTGLMWKQCAEGLSGAGCATGAAATFTWAQALVAVAPFAGYSDWRLPNDKELQSIVEYRCASPAINATLFPAPPSNWFWSSASYAAVSSGAWSVNFSLGLVFAGNKSYTYYVRLVRGGQSLGSFDALAGYTPDAYTFTAASNAALSTAVESGAVTLAGLTTVTGIKVSGGQYAVSTDGGANYGVYTANPGAVSNGNKVKVRVTSSGSNSTAVSATLTVGGVDGVFSATTPAGDVTSPAYQSAALNVGLTVATLTFDEALVNNLASIDPLLKANITFAADGTTFSALAAGDTVAIVGSTLTVTFASALSGNTNKLKIAANSLKDAAGNVLASAVTTVALDAVDTSPTAFSFTAATNTAISTSTESASITVTGINAASAISIVGGQYAISTDNGATWGAYTAGAGTVNLNDRVKVKLTSSSGYSTAATATLTIGGVSAAFSVTTQAAPAPIYDPGPYIPPTPTVINAPSAVETTLTGTTPVNAAPGSTLVIPAGTSVSGVAITLAAPAAGATAQPVTINIGANTLTVTPSGANVVVTLKTVTVNGVPTLVLAVSSGTATISAAPGQPLLTVSNSGVVITAGANGGTVAFDGSGAASLSVTSGYVVLSANAFAEAGTTNGFAASPLTKDGKVYAGEIAQLDADGKVAQVRLGSLNGSGMSLGDALKPASAAGLEVKAVVPSLKGKVVRVSTTQDFTAALSASLGKEFTAQGQNADGVLLLGFAGGKIQALPYGDVTVDTSRADGVTLTALGRAEVAAGGVVASFAPAVDDFAQFAASLAKMDKNAVVSVLEDGMVHVRLNGVTYPLQPAWTVSQEQAGQAGLTVDGQGMIVYRDSAGNRQILYPVFADLPRLIAVFKALDANATAVSNGDGTVSAKFQGKTYTLKPDYRLTTAPLDQAGKSWWQDKDGRVFIRNADGSAQGFSVQ